MADMITGCGFTNVFDIGSQDLPFPAGATGDAAVVEKAMAGLAEQIIAAYKKETRAPYLDNLLRLQIVGGRYTEASQTLATLRDESVNLQSPQTAAFNIQDQIFARANV